jgi:hypothetical protein|tara:strand:+ start:94 stop:306 length:213 start_codon:yes stop_codon:yes gene_type:complete
MKDKLSGKKTYFTAAAAVLTALGAYFAGEVDLTVTIQAVFAALMVVFLRKGVTSEAAKAAGDASAEKPAE